MDILGISGNFYRGSADAAAVLLRDGRMVAAAEEERFVRVKHAPSQMPDEAIRFCLSRGGIEIDDVDVLAFPQITWADVERNLFEFCEFQFGGRPKTVRLVEHHVAHAASAYRFSGFDEAMILTADWSGDGIAAILAAGERGDIKVLDRLPAPAGSLGIYYALITQFLGFRKWDDEYKVMGLASYGEPDTDLSWLLRGDGERAFALDESALNETLRRPYPSLHGLQQPSFSPAVVERLGPHRVPGTPITERHRNLAASAQRRLEEVAVHLIRALHAETGFRNLCVAGGVGLNCSMNGALLALDCVDSIYVPPVPNDSGIALGAAAEVATQEGFALDRLDHASWGPEYDAEEIRRILERSKVPFEEHPDVADFAARAIADGRIVGWFQGRMELGARALGNRSILADPRRADMRDRINYFVKFREDFRPLAPSLLEERAVDFLVGAHPSPFMTITFGVQDGKRDLVPAITHVDGTARPQTVADGANPRYRRLIELFDGLTGVPVVLNTSLNVRGDPIAMKPEDALATFYSTGLDHLVIGDFVLSKETAR
jgi:carbamoyltransferase